MSGRNLTNHSCFEDLQSEAQGSYPLQVLYVGCEHLHLKQLLTWCAKCLASTLDLYISSAFLCFCCLLLYSKYYENLWPKITILLFLTILWVIWSTVTQLIWDFLENDSQMVTGTGNSETALLNQTRLSMGGARQGVNISRCGSFRFKIPAVWKPGMMSS